ncbi:hypothetical protein MIR68_007334 [Amoeboaphelidium protococcarum]|nr:hypothetical protein MIR68_007334 [Amoeboaphelidium protococcarum]
MDLWQKCDFKYAKCYCEENVWMMANQMIPDINELSVIFITNNAKQVLLRHHAQRSHVIWDYHVVLLRKDESIGNFLVFDLDSQLEFPVDLQTYIDSTFDLSLPQFMPGFRVVSARKYLDLFCSDRKHMIANGQYITPPPSWDCIQNSKAQCSSNLSSYLDLSNDAEEYGRVLMFQDFLREFLRH